MFELIFYIYGVVYVVLALYIEKKVKVHWMIWFSLLWGTTLFWGFNRVLHDSYTWFWALLFGIIAFIIVIRKSKSKIEKILAIIAVCLGVFRAACFFVILWLTYSHPALLGEDSTGTLRLQRIHPVVYLFGFGDDAYLWARSHSQVAQAKGELEQLKRENNANKPDLFAPQQNYKRVLLPDSTIMYYSLGPDQRDDKGQIIYDPTNGTFSGGDIVVYGYSYETHSADSIKKN